MNPHLFSIDWFPSFNSAGWFIEWSLFMETQLGPGESALCCWTLSENKKQDFCEFDRSCTYIISRAVKFWSVGWLVNRYALVRPNSLWSDNGWCSFHKNKELLNPLFKGREGQMQTDLFYVWVTVYIVLEITLIMNKLGWRLRSFCFNNHMV